MSNGANYIHQQLRRNLENYVKAQYFAKSPLLLSALSGPLDEEGLLYRKPYIESSPAYKTVENGLEKLKLPGWLREFFQKAAASGLGVYSAPFQHQMEALESFYAGEDLFVSTGTGSGKTECFLWPILAKLLCEARQDPSWAERGLRTIILYPMNALVSDQVGRLRRLLGDEEDVFLDLFRETCGQDKRRPQFGMYTGRTPYPGTEPSPSQDHQLERTLSLMTQPKTEAAREYLSRLTREGKIPAKSDMASFLSRLHRGEHIPNEEDAELITRYEMQQFCPDILITNYSMLEYMLLRPRERRLWESTRSYLNADPSHKLLFIIDEAHMYRGSAGGEVALLIRRLLRRLQIPRERVQFILTTASMPNQSKEDERKVLAFARDLTGAASTHPFRYLVGEQERIEDLPRSPIPTQRFFLLQAGDFEEEATRLRALNHFWSGVKDSPAPFASLTLAAEWMYQNLLHYEPFYQLILRCRGAAVSLDELAGSIFPSLPPQKALTAVSVLLAIAPIAKNQKGAILFPARMHMLFKGIKGVYACTNPDCPKGHTGGGLRLGEVTLTDGTLLCPACQSTVYELVNDRRCGALFFKGYIFENALESKKRTYLWRYTGQLLDMRMKEIHLYIPPEGFALRGRQGKNAIKPCYLDTQSGFIDFQDDSLEGQAGIRKLYYCNYSEKGRPSIITFPTCPHCQHQLSHLQLTGFHTRGNLSFFHLIRTQFQSQPPVPGKEADPERFPNQGRKVLVFSDSRQRAAKLARDMSETSDTAAARQLFALAVRRMEDSPQEQSMDAIYDYFCLEAARRHVHLFHDREEEIFASHCATVLKNYERSQHRNRPYVPRFTTGDAPLKMLEYLLRLFSGGYDTLYDSALCYFEPMDRALYEAMDELEEQGIEISEEELLEIFNAWLLSILDSATALGHGIPDEVRLQVRQSFGRSYGLLTNWEFSKSMQETLGWQRKPELRQSFRSVLTESFLSYSQAGTDKLYVDLKRIKPRFLEQHIWYLCEKCSEVTAFLLKEKCPFCGSEHIHPLTKEEYASLSFWRAPIQEVLRGGPISIIDTQEHTAQLSHKDQRDQFWSKTEEYELRFQDLTQPDERPVDILSSTTTMEVGIDIGSLVAVGLRNIPPMRENYQQRAGRAGRRGCSLSTIITFCEDGPHDTLYFKDPVPMFRGDPRRPWIDIHSEKLLQRHMNLIVLQEFLGGVHESLERMKAAEFLKNLAPFFSFLSSYEIPRDSALLPEGTVFDLSAFRESLKASLDQMRASCEQHPELFGIYGEDQPGEKAKTLLDALYEDGIIPTYSFPKHVVSTYIYDSSGTIQYQVERGLDLGLNEYAPGRSIVVDKQTYQIGGLYYPGSEKQRGRLSSPAESFIKDPNYLKRIVKCENCDWFGLATDQVSQCPFCGKSALVETRQMLRPWGFAPRNGTAIAYAQLEETYSYAGQPLYSTLPESESMTELSGTCHIRVASRANQRILMLNKGSMDHGFMVCPECGAAMPGEDAHALDGVGRPYQSKYLRTSCKHSRAIHVNLGYDFVTDMLVMEFSLDKALLATHRRLNLWLGRAAQSLAEAFRLVASKELDIEFTELVTGYRLRENSQGTYVDLYLYDSLSSGAGYAASVAENMEGLLGKVEALLSGCDCEASCYKCLKHYRNQFVHGLLDRFAALDLLNWGIYGKRAEAIDLSEQQKLIRPLSRILKLSGYEVVTKGSALSVKGQSKEKPLVIYPSMWAAPLDEEAIYLSEAYIRYAKPYAVDAIMEKMK